MTAELILVRHAEVASRFHGRCYGRSDVELSPAGEDQSKRLSKLLCQHPIKHLFHSGLRRTRFLAEQIANDLQVQCEPCEALQERDFGSWELEPWDALYQQVGDEMLRVISEPQSYRPGGGETTDELRDRVLDWFHRLPTDGLVLAVTHGGPIAALRGTCLALPVTDWLQLIPGCGEFVSLSRHDSNRRTACRS